MAEEDDARVRPDRRDELLRLADDERRADRSPRLHERPVLVRSREDLGAGLERERADHRAQRGRCVASERNIVPTGAEKGGELAPNLGQEPGQAPVQEIGRLALQLALPRLVALEDRPRAGAVGPVVQIGDLGIEQPIHTEEAMTFGVRPGRRRRTGCRRLGAAVDPRGTILDPRGQLLSHDAPVAPQPRPAAAAVGLHVAGGRPAERVRQRDRPAVHVHLPPQRPWDLARDGGARRSRRTPRSAWSPDPSPARSSIASAAVGCSPSRSCSSPPATAGSRSCTSRGRGSRLRF